MKAQQKSPIVRRSIALPKELVEEAKKLAPQEIKNNFNRLVIVALEDYSARRRKLAFEEAMERMGNDPEIRTQSKTISREFIEAEEDGLTHAD